MVDINDDIKLCVREFMQMRIADARYASFDYCYGYFWHYKVKAKDNIEQSCVVLAQYLMSWGMARGSTALLQSSARVLRPVIEYICKHPKIWSIDVHNYGDNDNIGDIQTAYNEIKNILINGFDNIFNEIKERTSSATAIRKQQTFTILVTKILLGVYGCVPAYDTYFCKAFRLIKGAEFKTNETNDKLSQTLPDIQQFYVDYRTIIDDFAKEYKTINFNSGEATGKPYTKAKIIDMYGFTKGKKIAAKEKADRAKKEKVAMCRSAESINAPVHSVCYIDAMQNI